MKINVSDSIIILDEAHNIVNAAEEYCSKKLKIEDLMSFKLNISDRNLL